MERLQRKYAIIYIDREGVTLKEGAENFATTEMVSDYYNNSGFLQWNFYLIIPESLVPNKKMRQTIHEDDKYTRKFVVPDTAIESFIEDLFPIMKEKVRHQIKLIKGVNFTDALSQAINTHRTEPVKLIQSWYRDESLMHSLTEMDKLRAELINDPKKKVIFFSHISNEFSIAEKKFKLFTAKGFK